MSCFGIEDIIGMAIFGMVFGILMGYVICLYRYRKRVSDEIQEVLKDIKYIRGYAQATIDRHNEATESTKELRLKQDSINEHWLSGYKNGWASYDTHMNHDGFPVEPKDMFDGFEKKYEFRTEFLKNSFLFM